MKLDYFKENIKIEAAHISPMEQKKKRCPYSFSFFFLFFSDRLGPDTC
jgi:hypothetical protein